MSAVLSLVNKRGQEQLTEKIVEVGRRKNGRRTIALCLKFAQKVVEVLIVEKWGR
jgi:hypothetical protein